MKTNRLTLLRRPWRLPAAPVLAAPVRGPARAGRNAQEGMRNRLFVPSMRYQSRAAQARSHLSAAAL